MNPKFGIGAVLLSPWCNIFGAETGGAILNLGGLSEAKARHQWYCDNRAIGRYRMECEHGHRGQIMPLCEKHLKMYGNGKVQFCPRCNTTDDHRCKLELKEVS